MNRDKIINDFKTAIRSENLKVTAQRLNILKNLIENSNHRECEEIYLDLHQKGSIVSRATIYRTLDIAVKYGFARKMDIGEGKARYETRLDENHHDHMVCTKCGKITEFYNDEIEKIQLEICNSHSSHLVRHSHQLFVICPECQKI